MSFSVAHEINSVSIRLQFIDNQGGVRFLCNNTFSDQSYHLDESKNSNVVCSISELPLPIGTYNIHLTAFARSGPLDDVEQVLSFDVIGGDFFKTGREQVSKLGVLVKNSFILNQGS